MKTPDEFPFQSVLDALLDTESPFPPSHLYQLSDLDPLELAQLKEVWPRLPTWRRKALLEDAAELSEDDTLLSFLELGILAIKDIDPQVRVAAIRTLSDYEERDLIQVLLELLQPEEDEEVQAEAASSLGRFVYLGEIEELRPEVLRRIEDNLLNATMQSKSDLVRRRALESLGYSSRSEIAPLIEAAYRSEDKDWIASSLYAMSCSANDDWKPHIMAMLQSNLPLLRYEAARAAGELEIMEARPHLIDLLDDADENTRNACIWSLSQIGGEGVREILENLYEETEDEDELEYIESALDNLAFNEEIKLFPIFDFPEFVEDEDLEDYLDLMDDDNEEDFDD